MIYVCSFCILQALSLNILIVIFTFRMSELFCSTFFPPLPKNWFKMKEVKKSKKNNQNVNLKAFLKFKTPFYQNLSMSTFL